MAFPMKHPQRPAPQTHVAKRSTPLGSPFPQPRQRPDEPDALQPPTRALRVQTKTAYQLQQVDDLWSAKYAKRIQDQTEAIDRQATRASELQRELDEAAQRHRQAHEEARQQHEVELEQLRVRVQQALGKKDTTIQELQAALQKVEARNRQMEDVLLEQSNKA